MFHIDQQSRDGFDDGDAALFAKLERDMHRDARSEACDDDVEVKCPYIGVCPDESNHEHGSPLDFKQDPMSAKLFDDSAIAREIQEAMRLGFGF